jgi:hypothetical protein
MTNKVRAAQVLFGKFLTNVHKHGAELLKNSFSCGLNGYSCIFRKQFITNKLHVAGPADGPINFGFTALLGLNLSCIGYSVVGLMGNVPKIEG